MSIWMAVVGSEYIFLEYFAEPQLYTFIIIVFITCVYTPIGVFVITVLIHIQIE